MHLAYQGIISQAIIDMIQEQLFGELWVAGSNVEVQLGTGHDKFIEILLHQNPYEPSDWKQLVTSTDFCFGIKNDGTLWSTNFGGVSVPTQIGSDSDWDFVALNDHIMILKEDGTLWGMGDNSYGQLGLGNTDYQSAPVQVGTDTNWAHVACGNNFTLAVKTDGTLWSTGYNYFGQLGLNDNTNRSSLTQVTGTNWAKVFSGESYSSFAIKSDGTLWSWGDGSYGVLGQGSDVTRWIPGQVVYVGVPSTGWAKITSENRITVALRTDGSIWAWGQISGADFSPWNPYQITVPPEVGGNTGWIDIAVNGYAIQDDGVETTLWKWDSNKSFFSNDPPIKFSELTGWTALSGSGIRPGTLFALRNGVDGQEVWVSGRHDNNIFGMGDSGKRYSEMSNILISQVIDPYEETWTGVYPGHYHSVGIKTDGTLWGWGANWDLQLGVGSGIDYVYAPEQISVDTGWKSAAGAESHTIFLKDDGTIYGTGEGWNNQIVPDMAISFPSIVLISGSGDWDKIYSGFYHNLAIKTDGTLWGWGANWSGQLGLGNTDPVTVITQVGTDTNWDQVATADDFNLAIKKDGTLWAWGENWGGQLGQGDYDTRLVPTQVGTDTNWKQVSCAAGVSFAIKTDGTLWSWGYGSDALGHGNYDDILVPTQIILSDGFESNTNWVKVSVAKSLYSSSSFVFAIQDDGQGLDTSKSLWSWGVNDYGVLGHDDYDDLMEPKRITRMENGTYPGGWIDVQAGIDFVVAIREPVNPPI